MDFAEMLNFFEFQIKVILSSFVVLFNFCSIICQVFEF